MRLLSLLFSLAILYPATVVSQVKDDVVIEGTIFDDATKEPLPFANISLPNNRIGTVSNVNGQFRIIIPSARKSESLRISYIGFKSITIKISEIAADARFFLVEDLQALDEVVVVGLTAQSILKKAIQKIPENYYDSPYKSKGFYRITAKKEDRYIRLSEAAFELYHSEKSSNGNQLKLEKIREIKDEQVLHNIFFGKTPKGIFRSDLINNLDESEFLDKKGMTNHTFNLETTTSYNGKEVYVISFDQKDGIKKVGYRGKLVIDLETFAFIHLDYGWSPKSIQYYKPSAPQRILMELFDIHVGVSKSDTQINYKKIGDKYYLSSVHDAVVFPIQSTREQFDFGADAQVDYLITDIETENCQPFANEEALGKNKQIEYQSSMSDSTFWDEHTVLLPNFDFETIAKSIAAKNKTREIKTEIADLLFKYPKKNRRSRIDSVLTFYNRRDLFNGNALIAYNGEVVFQKSYNNSLTKNHQNTQFRIGSTSETFTSMLIMLLENEGKLNISDSIGMYLPEYIHGGITIEQLLTHQSGIPNYTVNESKPYPLDEVVHSFCSNSMEFEPGSKFEYSNSNYVILSLIIEKITSKAYAKVLKERIFDKLKMDESYFGEPVERTNLAIGYMYGKPEPIHFVQNLTGAGGITSTTEDLLKWSNAIDEGTLLPKEQMQKLFVPRADYSEWEADYGYGWMLDRYMFRASKKHQINYHTGTELGFYSMFLKQPDEKISIILLSNTGDFPRYPIADLILNALGKWKKSDSKLSAEIEPNNPSNNGSESDKIQNYSITNSIDLWAGAFRKKQRIPGLQLAVMKDDSLVYSNAFGYSDKINKVKTNSTTQFRIASVSKPLTSAGLMKLVSEGKVDLDQSIQHYVPSFSNKKYPVTVRQLLGHLGGVRDYYGKSLEEEIFVQDHFNNSTEAISIFSEDALVAEPGTQFVYSSFGYTLLGAVIESASKQSYLEYMNEEIWKPLNMDFTYGDISDSTMTYKSKFYFLSGEESTPYDLSYSYPSGGLVSTSEDLVNFGSALLENELLGASITEQVFETQYTSNGESTGYGFGWYTGEDFNGGNVWYHAGELPSSGSMILIYPEYKLVIALLANSPILSGTDDGFSEELQNLGEMVYNYRGW
ncbi:MAG: serine hydrolase [Cyclobacteriaceae bacterium]